MGILMKLLKKKYLLPTILISIAIAVSLVYVFSAGNEIDVNLQRSRYIINERFRNIELDRFPLRLQLDFDRLLKEFETITLEKEWTTDISFDITHPPFFDMRNIYLVSFDKIAVYDKSTLNSIWMRQLDHDIVSFSLIDGNNILILDIQGNVQGLSRGTGESIWSFVYGDIHLYNMSFSVKPLQITNSDDKRLLSSVLILPINDQIMIVDINSGEILFSLDFDDMIYHISEYDPLENAIYVGVGDKLAKLLLKKN
jgi:hypothetical protein